MAVRARLAATLGGLALAAAPVTALAVSDHSHGHGGGSSRGSSAAGAGLSKGQAKHAISLGILPTPVPIPSPIAITLSTPVPQLTPIPIPAPAPAPIPISAATPTNPPAPAGDPTPAPTASAITVAPVAVSITNPPVAAALDPVAGSAAAVPARPRSSRPEGLSLPGLADFVLPPGPEGTRIGIALLALPLLVATWIWALARLAGAGRRRRVAGQLGFLAAQVGVSAESLAVLPAEDRDALVGNLATDPVTGLPLRAPGTALLEREIASASRLGAPLALAFIDVDGLKAANDRFGHAAGDRLLKSVADILRGRLRASDIVYRHAGDEFIVLLPGTPMAAACDVLAELRRQATAAGSAFSYGVAALRPGEAAADLIARADGVQYEDKRQRKSGRPRLA